MGFSYKSRSSFNFIFLTEQLSPEQRPTMSVCLHAHVALHYTNSWALRTPLVLRRDQYRLASGLCSKAAFAFHTPAIKFDVDMLTIKEDCVTERLVKVVRF